MKAKDVEKDAVMVENVGVGVDLTELSNGSQMCSD